MMLCMEAHNTTKCPQLTLYMRRYLARTKCAAEIAARSTVFMCSRTLGAFRDDDCVYGFYCRTYIFDVRELAQMDRIQQSVLSPYRDERFP